MSSEVKIKIDSLKYVISSARNDTVKVNAYVAWDDLIYLSNPELDLELNQKIAEICEFHINSKNKKQHDFYYRKLAYSCNNIGIFYEENGAFSIALQYHLKSLEIQKRIGNQVGIGNSYNNLGILYNDSQDYEKADEYYQKALEIRKEINDSSGLGSVLNNIGLIYQKAEKWDLARVYLDDAQVVFNNLKDNWGKGMVEYNIGTLLMKKGELDSAEYHMNESLKINRKIAFKSRISSSLSQLAYIEIERGTEAKNEGRSNYKVHYEKAKQYASEALQIAKEINSYSDQRVACDQLHFALKELGEYKQALEVHELLSQSKDSMDFANNSRLLMSQKYQYEYDQKVERDSIQLAEEKKVQDAHLEKEKIQKYALYGGIVLSLIFGATIYNRFRKSQAQKSIIEQQKLIVEEKNTEILDSINYAKRIQAAILPPTHVIKKYLKDCTVIYMPKDIVAGDFYWLQNVGKQTLFAAADCTGHGVPGALVSVVCNGALNRSVKEYGLSEPGEILDKTREIVIEEFSKTNEDVKDGMDVALCSLEGLNLKYAGANNPLWIVRNDEVIEIKADKQPIGSFEYKKPFITHQIQLLSGDTFYLFSDGIVDQFGGEKGKKLKPKGLREILLRASKMSIQDQRNEIISSIKNWSESFDQVDDICLIAVKV